MKKYISICLFILAFSLLLSSCAVFKPVDFDTTAEETTAAETTHTPGEHYTVVDEETAATDEDGNVILTSSSKRFVYEDDETANEYVVFVFSNDVVVEIDRVIVFEDSDAANLAVVELGNEWSDTTKYSTFYIYNNCALLVLNPLESEYAELYNATTEKVESTMISALKQ